MPLGDVRANYRWFVREEGIERCHQWRKEQPIDRSLELTTIAQQLAGAEYVIVRGREHQPITDPR